MCVAGLLGARVWSGIRNLTPSSSGLSFWKHEGMGTGAWNNEDMEVWKHQGMKTPIMGMWLKLRPAKVFLGQIWAPFLLPSCHPRSLLSHVHEVCALLSSPLQLWLPVPSTGPSSASVVSSSTLMLTTAL